MKKVVFFDGDGTLWYPKSTLRTQKPHWVYNHPEIDDPRAELIVTPKTITTLKELGARGIRRVLLSSCPLPEEEAITNRIEIAQHVRVHGLLDDVRVAPDRQDGKAEQLQRLLTEFKISPQEALMVGDRCDWDYLAAVSIGVEAVLIATDYDKDRARELRITRTIPDIGQVLTMLGDT
jgi:phosphoglycolate phosphatase-like HAD superfamily hydrolase